MCFSGIVVAQNLLTDSKRYEHDLFFGWALVVGWPLGKRDGDVVEHRSSFNRNNEVAFRKADDSSGMFVYKVLARFKDMFENEAEEGNVGR